jgi:hypothetical protein
MKTMQMSKEKPLDRGIPEYLLGRESLFAGFCDGHISDKIADTGSLIKKRLDMSYAGINIKKSDNYPEKFRLHSI